MNTLQLRRRSRPAISSAGDGLPPGPGESIRTPISDDWRGIQFEIGKMVDYVQHFSTDALINKTSHRVVELCKAKDKLCEMNALFLWTKKNYRYVNDPPGREVLTTPASMLSDIMTPPNVLEHILGPDLVRQIQGFGVGESLFSYTTGVVECASCFRVHGGKLHPKASEDCDGGSTFLATMLAAVGIVPRFRFGGQKEPNGSCNYHHVWVQGRGPGGEWVDMDVTEEVSKLGWFFEGFGCFGHVPIFPGHEE